MSESKEYADAPKRVYAVQPTGTQLAHNKTTKEALVLLSSQPEIKEWARANALAAFQDELEQLVDAEARRLSEALFSAYGVQLCPQIAAVWVCDQLEKHLRDVTQMRAGMAYAHGDSKANLARAVGIRAQSVVDRFSQLKEIAAAQVKPSDSTEVLSDEDYGILTHLEDINHCTTRTVERLVNCGLLELTFGSNGIEEKLTDKALRMIENTATQAKR